MNLKKVKNFVKWVASIFFVLFGLVCISGSVFSGLLFLIGAVLINPLFQGAFEKKGRKIKKRFYIPVLAILFLAGTLTSDLQSSQTSDNEIEEQVADVENSDVVEVNVESKTEEKTDTIVEESEPVSEFKMHFIDVGQGDATLIQCDGESMLIDAGDVNKGTTVQLYLTKQDVKELKYVVGTHPDADHIGGLDVIITKYNCGTIYMPDKTSDSKAYQEVMDAIDYRNYKLTVPSCGEKFNIGSAECTVIGPVDSTTGDNNSSIVLRIEYGDTSFILSGDAEGSEEKDIIDGGTELAANVYHAGHHGSKTSSSDEWIKKISPEAIVISCGKDNSYGHPHAEALAAFKQLGAQIYRTDEQGNIVVTSDGKTLTWSCSPSESWAPGAVQQVEEPKQEEAPAQENVVEETSNQTTYVLNTNTKKFHYSYCSSASDIKTKNRKEITGTRDDIIGMGYQPCKRCNP